MNTKHISVSEANRALDAIEAERAAPGYEGDTARLPALSFSTLKGADWDDGEEFLDIPAFLRRQAD